MVILGPPFFLKPVDSHAVRLLSRFRSLTLSHGAASSKGPYLMKNRLLTYIRPVSEALLLASGPDEIRPLPPYHPSGLYDPVPNQAYGKGGEPVFFIMRSALYREDTSLKTIC